MKDALKDLYRQTALPVFQNRMYDSVAAGRNCPKGDMRLVEDLCTGLVRNAEFDPALMDYDSAYQNEQGNSPRFRSHMNDVADLVLGHMGREGLIEVGCGKGLFLEVLADRGICASGFDPAYEGDSPNVQKVYFSEELGIKGEGLILRHVLEHIEDPIAFLRRLASANGNRGLIYIEVPCFDWIVENRAWYDVFYEHVNYFRLGDFLRIFGRVVHADHSFGGQYLRIIGDLATIRQPQYDPDDSVHFPSDFLMGIDEVLSSPGPIIVWGGASKGVIFALYLERSGRNVDRIIDINPAKQGRFLPGTGLCVSSPEEGVANLPNGSTIYVMNPNYLDEVRQMAGTQFHYKVPK